MESIHFGMLQWPEIIGLLVVMGLGALLLGLLIYVVIRLSRK